MQSNTLVINLFGGPGTSKSTSASHVFSSMKRLGVKCELVREFAKELTFTEDWKSLGCQPYVSATQLKRQYDLLGKVDVMITDSPLLTGLVYPGFGSTEAWRTSLVEQFNLFTNLNIFLVRDTKVHAYQTYGRTQSEEEAVKKDLETKELLIKLGIPFAEIPVLPEDGTIKKIVNLYLEYQAKTPTESKEISLYH